jgi:hypothetical protein
MYIIMYCEISMAHTCTPVCACVRTRQAAFACQIRALGMGAGMHDALTCWISACDTLVTL